MNPTKCPLCKSDASYTREKMTPHTFDFECKVCGNFQTSDYGSDPTTDPQSPGINYGKISAWTRQESEAGRIALVTAAELKDPPNIFGGLSLESKFLRALRTLAHEHPSPGTEFSLETHDWPKFCDSGENEFGWMLNELGKRSWLNLSNAQTFADFYRGQISAAGWQALESAKRLDLQRIQSSNMEAKFESPYVFLCHASEDKAIAIAIAQQLHQNGINYFLDADDVRADHKLIEKIEEGLQRCTHFIALISQTMLNKKYPTHELKAITPRYIEDDVSVMVYALDAESISVFQRNYRLLSTAPIQKFDRAQLSQLVSDVLGLSRKPPAGALPAMANIADTHGLSKVAFAIIELMVKQSASALDRDPSFDDINELTNRLEATPEDFRDAIDELKQLGAISEARYAGGRWQVRAKPELFAQFDQLFQPWNPEHDARTIASRLFANNAGGESIAAEKLTTDLGWEPRRMNPAIQYLLSRDLIIRSKELGQNYVQHWLMPSDATRRFVKRIGKTGAP